MAKSTLSITGTTRAVFSNAARVAFQDCDQPMTALDNVTGCALTYRFEAHAGGTLHITNGVLGRKVLMVACDFNEVDRIAALLLDGLRVQQS
jgi:hypothetical protein